MIWKVPNLKRCFLQLISWLAFPPVCPPPQPLQTLPCPLSMDLHSIYHLRSFGRKPFTPLTEKKAKQNQNPQHYLVHKNMINLLEKSIEIF